MKRVILFLFIAGKLWAGGEVLEYLDVDGKHYESVKWGPVNQGKVVIFHSRGVTFIPLEKLPPEYRARFGYKPEPAPAVSAPPPQIDSQKLSETAKGRRSEPPVKETGEWTVYSRERTSKIILDGKLVEKAKLVTLTGFLVKEQAQITSDSRVVNGAVLELARRREDAAGVAAQMELRPALWQRTGEQVILSEFTPTAIVGAMLRVHVVEDAAIDGRRVFRVGIEPSFEQWQALSRRQ